MLVVDASAALAWLLGEPEGEAVEAVLLANLGQLAVPAVFWVEVPYVLGKHVAWRNISLIQREELLVSAQSIGIETDLASASPGLEHQRALSLGDQFELTAFDAMYFELAVRTRATLVTLDASLARATRRIGLIAEIARDGG